MAKKASVGMHCEINVIITTNLVYTCVCECVYVSVCVCVCVCTCVCVRLDSGCLAVVARCNWDAREALTNYMYYTCKRTCTMIIMKHLRTQLGTIMSMYVGGFHTCVCTQVTLSLLSPSSLSLLSLSLSLSFPPSLSLPLTFP